VKSVNSTTLAVTTCANPHEQVIEEAEEIGRLLTVPVYSREGRSIPSFFERSGVERLLIVRRDRYSLHHADGSVYQFHPNLALVRAHNYETIGSDHFLEAAKLEPGDKVIDCTLGFGCEAILASLVIGDLGEVVGLESVPELAVVTRNGMGRYKLLQRKLQESMRRIVVLNFDYRDYLRKCASKSADIVYFDPFFDETLEGSTVTIGALAKFGNRAPLDPRSITEARRVAKRAVILKHPKVIDLPSEISDVIGSYVAGKRSPVAFAVIPPFGNAG